MLLARFFKDRRGGVAPLLALGAIPLIASVGAAVDYSRASAARAAMQGALDAAAIMLSKQAAQLSTAALGEKASAYFNANFARPDVQDPQVSVAASPAAGGTSLNLSATGSIKTAFMGVMGTGTGSTSVALNGCSLYDNSQSPSALTVGGSATISAFSVGVVGGISGKDGITTTQGIKTGVGPVADPYANDSFPNFFGCSQDKFTAKSTIAINPGVYCGGMTINAGANVTLNPGIYYLDGGSLSVNGGATISGNGVTLVFTKKTGSDWATATINGNATVNLTPPKSGPTAGIVVFGDRNIPVGTSFKFNGGATQYFGGAIYLPTAAITFAGGAGTATTCTQVIGNTVTFAGNSSLAINCSNYETKPFSPMVIKLAS